MRKLNWLSILCSGVLLVSRQVQAQDEFEEVKVLDHPKYSLTDRFVFDADFTYLPLDAYYKPMLIEIAASYQPVDWFSWEIARFGYSMANYDTGLKDSFNAELKANGVNKVVNIGEELKDFRFHASSTGFFNLLYSKSNFFNSSIVYHYWQLGSGVSYYDLDGNSQYALDLVLRARFFFHKHFMISIRGGHSLGFDEDAPRNLTFLGLGVGFAL